MKHYVAGFMFSPDLENVILIEKQKPDWQKGRYNAIGGKIEVGETPIQAMVREFEMDKYFVFLWFLRSWTPPARETG